VFHDDNVALFWWRILVGMSSVGLVILVEQTPWRWPRMCPFCVSGVTKGGSMVGVRCPALRLG